MAQWFFRKANTRYLYARIWELKSKREKRT
jgi:hypothetical protein